LNSRDSEDLKLFARRIRETVLQMTHRARSSHVGSCFSIVELLTTLYSCILRIRPDEPDWPDRDRLLLSKGHGAGVLYAVLAEQGFFPRERLDQFYANGTQLAGHVTHHGVPGVELSTGSLGHGLPVGCGMALAARRNGCPARVFVLLSDGECDEGSNWEAALFAPHHHLDNLTVIIDYNKIQSFGFVAEVLDLDPLAEKWRAFGWAVSEIDGHNHEEILATLEKLPLQPGKPTCVVAHTIKGRGVSFMEKKILWHYRPPDAKELELALEEIKNHL
jgi:transketolase